MSSGEPDPQDAQLPWAEGAKILDVLGDDVAGKRLLARRPDGTTVQVVEPPEDAQSSLAFRERFKEKAARATKLEHECIVPTLGFAEDAGKLFLVEPQVEGVSLAELIKPGRGLECDAVLEVGLHVARALEVLHRHGLVHGWVRPDAILATDDNARLRGCGLEHPKGETPGRPDFMSPEQLTEDRSLRPESDFFSLGSVLFTAFVGRQPFTGEAPEAVADAIRHGRATYPAHGEPQLPENVGLLLAKLLAADYGQRPRSAEELIADIEAVRRGEPIERVTERPPPPARPKAEPRISRKQAVILAAAAGICVVASAFFVIWRHWGDESAPPIETVRSEIAQTTGPAAAIQRPVKTAPPREQHDAVELADALYRAADDYARAHPQNFDEIIRRFRAAAAKYPGTPAALKAERKATECALKKSGERLSAFARVQAEADKLVKAKQFGVAMEAFKKYETLHTAVDGAPPPGLHDEVERQISFVRAKAAEAYARESKQASEAVQAERYKDAADVYENIVALYGIEEYANRARKELAIIRPLLAASEKVAAAKALKELERAYRETAVQVQARVRTFDLERAVADSEALLKRLKGSALEPNAVRHLGHLRRLLALKQRVIEKINSAPQKLTSEALGIRAPASVMESADADGITLRSKAGLEKRPWAKLSDWEKYAIARKVSNVESPDDLAALGLLSLEQGNRARAVVDLERANRLGAQVGDLLARAKGTGGQPAAEDEPGRMLVEARALVAEKRWLDALVLLVPLKEEHAAANYAIREKLDEINALLAQCSRGLARADIERDIAAGVETDLLADGVGAWKKRGEGWAFSGGRVTCDNKAEHDVDMLKPALPAAAYRLSVRCRVVSGNGLMVRLASDGNNHYDFWLGLVDKAKTGLWHSRGGDVAKSELVALRVNPGEWFTVRAIVTGRYVRVACLGRSVLLPHNLAADAARTYGFITRQKSKAEFEDFRIRILREQ